MNWLLNFFNYHVLSLFGAPVTVLEILGFVTGALCVWAIAKQYKWNFYVAIVNSAAYIFLFWNIGLYADAFLQVIFIALAGYGIYKWTFSGKEGLNTLHVREVTKRETISLTLLGLIAITLVALFLHLQTDSTVYVFDAYILAASVAATYLQAKKVYEAWWVWIAVDIVSIPLYFHKGLTLTSVLYIVYLLLCIKGLFEWRKALKGNIKEKELEENV